MSRNEQIFKVITQKILEKMNQGIVPWHKPWKEYSNGNLPRNGVTGRNYSGINLFLSFMNEYSSKEYFTFKQIKDLKGVIKKGEEGNLIVFWNWITPKAKEEEEENVKAIPFLRYYYVWNRDQCEGLPESKSLKNLPSNELSPIQECEKVISGYKDCPEIRYQEARAYYSVTHDFINLPLKGSFESPEEFYSTAFHEMIHSTGSEKRLKRVVRWGKFGDGDYSREELCAELGASFICGICGIENRTIDNSASYIQNWMKRLTEDVKLFFDSAQAASKAVDYVLGTTKEGE